MDVIVVPELKEQYEYVINSPVDVINSLSWYTEHSYLNYILRTSVAEFSEEQKYHMNKIDEAFLNVPLLKSTIIVYRGIKDEKGIIDNEIDPAFISTSIDKTQAEIFMNSISTNNNCCLLHITISPGSKVLPLWDVSRARNEKELLLDRNGKLIITGKNIDKQERTVLYVTYIPFSEKEEKEVIKDNIISELIKLKQKKKFLDFSLLITIKAKKMGINLTEQEIEEMNKVILDK